MTLPTCFLSTKLHLLLRNSPILSDHFPLQNKVPYQGQEPRKMRGNDAPAVVSIPSATATSGVKKVSSESSFSFTKNGYKFWVLTAILLLALWSMVTGSVTLKWSTGNLTHLSEDPDFPIHDDLDVLEVEEKEKVVRRMWDVYTHSSNTKLPRFWQEAFEAAYEALVSEVAAVRNEAVSEIAKMSLRSINHERLSFGTTIDGWKAKEHKRP
ncbi:hypothetical protein K2173_027923 [Erythroxylum novogranatense]|uniref:Sugar transporter n=1 Tax=Erythroxylum novogranatense TaxID=1862640 RepID=A0AAV8U0F8_9ROSI|nr:hypothetical protein K2173_027923 [Erythroxylum novogranatense]